MQAEAKERGLDSSAPYSDDELNGNGSILDNPDLLL